MRQFSPFWALLVLILTVSGCASKKGNMVLFENVQMRFQVNETNEKPAIFLINNSADLSRVLSSLELVPARGMPDLNIFLEDRSLIVIHAGRRISANNKLYVIKVVENKKGMTVRARILVPGQNCGNNNSVTYPVQVIAVPKVLAGKLTLDLIETLQNCN
jgi:hypothetical protein